MEVSVVVCQPRRPLRPFHAENLSEVRNQQRRRSAWCARGAMRGVFVSLSVTPVGFALHPGPPTGPAYSPMQTMVCGMSL